MPGILKNNDPIDKQSISYRQTVWIHKYIKKCLTSLVIIKCKLKPLWDHQMAENEKTERPSVGKDVV